jgi:hypothetical protein
VEIAHGLAVELGEKLNLGDIHPPLTHFALGNEGLGLPELLSGLDLRDPCLLTRYAESVQEHPIGLRIDALGHGNPLSGKPCYYSVLV